MFLPGELAAKQHRAWSRLLHKPGNTGCFFLFQVRAAGKAQLLGSAPPSFETANVRQQWWVTGKVVPACGFLAMKAKLDSAAP